MNTTVVAQLQKQLESFSFEAQPEGVGRVSAVGDGVVEITGLPQALMAEAVVFDTGEGRNLETALHSADTLYGVVLNLEEYVVRAVVLGDARKVREGMTAVRTGTVLSVPVGEALVGRVVNTLGEPLDGKGPLETSERYPIERPAHPVIERASVNTPLHTGVRAIDALVPIGRGQRELIIGDRFTGKTTIAIDTILAQRYEPEATRPICVYVAIGQKESKTAKIVAHLKEAGALDYTIVVNAPASDPAVLQFYAPYAGVSMAEYFMEKGKDVLIVYDDLSKQAVAYREMSLLLRRPPGREAFPGDIFYAHSRLLERSAKLSKEQGGGSITALPIIETLEGDVSAYIPTNVISITDGQIYLETDLFHKGQRPAVHVGLSVSRVGSSAQTKVMKKVAGTLRIELAQYRELESFSQFASDLDEETTTRLAKGARMTEALKQPPSAPIPFYLEAVLLFAFTENAFARVPLSEVSRATKEFMTFLEATHAEVLADIKETRDITDAQKEVLREACSRFEAAHPEFFRV
jgi:F-type H+-transporting ATPase subunit alpha